MSWETASRVNLDYDILRTDTLSLGDDRGSDHADWTFIPTVEYLSLNSLGKYGFSVWLKHSTAETPFSGKFECAELMEQLL